MKAELESMLLDLDGPVNLAAPLKSGLMKSNWCIHKGSRVTWADVDGDGAADLLCDDTNGHHWAILSDGSGGIKKDLGMYQTHWCVDTGNG